MHPELADLLACPATGAALRLADGRLSTPSGPSYPIVRGVPRFVGVESYASTFGFQWTRWARTQLDSISGTGIFRARFERYFGTPAQLEGLSVLDAGCGAGAFLDVVAPYAGRVVGVDLSEAVEPAFASTRQHRNVDVVQADLMALPFPDGAFDFVYCIGVLQHTPDPAAAFRSLARVVRPGGTLAIWMYERSRWEALKPRHLVRRYSAGLPPEKAMAFVERYYRAARPLRGRLRRLPGGRLLARLIPVSELSRYAGDLTAKLAPDEVEEWELLDTHDMLITVYDKPQTANEVARWFRREGIRPVRTGGAEDIAMVGTKPPYLEGLDESRTTREKSAMFAPTLAGT